MPDDRFLFIKRSAGGTSLYGCWNPYWTKEKAQLVHEQGQPPLYRDFTDYVRDVLSPYSPLDYEICGLLWVQGEADSNVSRFGPVPAETYGDNLQFLIEETRRQMDEADLPFLIMQVGNGKVVEGMQRAAETMTNVSFISQSRNPLSSHYLSRYGPPVGHYDYKGIKRIGELFAQEYLSRYAK